MDPHDALTLMMHKNEQALKQIQILNQQLQLSNQEKQELRQQIVGLNHDLLLANSKCEALDKQILSQNITIAQQAKLIQAQQPQVLQPEFTSIKQNNDKSYSEYKEVLFENSEYLTKINELTDLVDTLQNKIQAGEVDNQRLEEHIKQLEIMSQRKDKFLQQFQDQFKKQQEQYNEEMERMNQRLHDLNEKMVIKYQNQLEEDDPQVKYYKDLYEGLRKQNKQNIHEEAIPTFGNRQEEPQQVLKSQISPKTVQQSQIQYQNKQQQMQSQHILESQKNEQQSQPQSVTSYYPENMQRSFNLKTVQTEHSQSSYQSEDFGTGARFMKIS